MLNPNGALHFVVPFRVTARTCAQRAYGVPVIQGSARGIATAGALRSLFVQIRLASANVLRVASSNS